MGLLSGILDVLNPISKIVDEFHTSDAEKLELKAKLLDIQAGVITQAVDFEKTAIASQSSIITAEAQSDSWLTKSWRPIMMLTFMALLVLNWLGVGPQTLPPELWTVIKIGLGGYIGGRSLEKTVPAVVSALKSKEQT